MSRPELKIEDEGGFIQFFKDLPPADSGVVRLFDRGDWYSAHGDDATFIANAVYKSTSVIRQLGRNDHTGLPSVTMTVTVFRQFLRECLLKLLKRVEIWASPGARMPWRLAKHASPGNLQDVEDELGGTLDAAPMIAAVKVSIRTGEPRTVGVCFADASVRELGVSEFIDTDLYSNLEALVIQLGIRECLVSADRCDRSDPDQELAKVRQILDSCGIAITTRPSSDFGSRDVEQDIGRILRDDRGTGLLPQSELRLAMGAAAALIKYLAILQDTANFGQYSLYQHDLADYMRLDAAALRALNLMPGHRDGGHNMSLFGVLNHCRTPLGPRLLTQWLKQPLMSQAEIERRQQLVAAFVDDTQLRQSMQEEHLRTIPDLYRLAGRFHRRRASLEDVVRAYQVAIRLPGFLGTLEGVTDERAHAALDAAYTAKLRALSDSLGRLEEMVESTVDLAALDRHEYVIKPEFDDGLRQIRRRLDRVDRDIADEFAQAASDLGQEANKKIFLENHRAHGFCMRLTRQEAGCIRGSGQYREISTQKNGVYFTTGRLMALRRDFDTLSQSYSRTQSSLVGEVVAVAATYSPVLEALAGVLAHLDVVVSLAHAAVNAPTSYVRPRMHARGAEGRTVLRDARHPCIELQDDVQFITNDVELDRAARSFLVLTGPNMGGKSTYIRLAGVISLMAQIGCFVPCAEAELNIFDSILARVGAGDSQLKGLSTFMSEMMETATILKSATKESLIIIDELGRGTSTYDGFGLAWAISEHIIREIGCVAMFATHFHELTTLESRYPQVHNLHVTAHVSGAGSEPEPAPGAGAATRDVTLLYKVASGICDQSFGIHVAELVRFPDKVVRMARRKADELEDFTSKHDAQLPARYSQEDMLEGSALIKDMLARWRAETSAGGADLSRQEMTERLRVLALADAKLLENPFFQAVRTL